MDTRKDWGHHAHLQLKGRVPIPCVFWRSSLLFSEAHQSACWEDRLQLVPELAAMWRPWEARTPLGFFPHSYFHGGLAKLSAPHMVFLFLCVAAQSKIPNVSPTLHFKGSPNFLWEHSHMCLLWSWSNFNFDSFIMEMKLTGLSTNERRVI